MSSIVDIKQVEEFGSVLKNTENYVVPSSPIFIQDVFDLPAFDIYQPILLANDNIAEFYITGIQISNANFNSWIYIEFNFFNAYWYDVLAGDFVFVNLDTSNVLNIMTRSIKDSDFHTNITFYKPVRVSANIGIYVLCIAGEHLNKNFYLQLNCRRFI